jgi:hypothetical protein
MGRMEEGSTSRAPDRVGKLYRLRDRSDRGYARRGTLVQSARTSYVHDVRGNVVEKVDRRHVALRVRSRASRSSGAPRWRTRVVRVRRVGATFPIGLNLPGSNSHVAISSGRRPLIGG